MFRGILAILVLLPCLAMAQDERRQTLADIRAELETLNGLILGLKQEMVQTGASGTGISNTQPVLQRIDALEDALRDVTGQVEALSFRVDRIVQDGTNRVGDLEYRLVELEGGDVSTLGATSTLGGEPTSLTLPDAGTGGSGPQLAVGETADFDSAFALYQSGDYTGSTLAFRSFIDNYPGGPLTVKATFWLGESQAAQGNWNAAARSYLDSFSSAPDGETADQALFKLAHSLEQLGQRSEACLTLSEIPRRFPTSPFSEQVPGKRSALGCS